MKVAAWARQNQVIYISTGVTPVCTCKCGYPELHIGRHSVNKDVY